MVKNKIRDARGANRGQQTADKRLSVVRVKLTKGADAGQSKSKRV